MHLSQFFNQARRTAIFSGYLAMAILILLLTNPACAQSNSPVTLYFPGINKQNPKLSKQIEEALAKQAVDFLSVKGTEFWHPYQNGIRTGKVGIYFAQPHMAAWLITRHNFSPIYRLHGNTNYALAVAKAHTSIFELLDLNGKRVCHEPGLNLGTIWLNQLLGENQIAANTIEVPHIETYMLTQNTKNCDSFIVEATAYNRVEKETRNKYIRLAQSSIYKHYALLAHPSIAKPNLDKLATALKKKELQTLLRPYFSDLSKWDNLIPIDKTDYSPSDIELLAPYWR